MHGGNVELVDADPETGKKKQLTKDDKRTVLETKNVKRLVEDIFNRRERKILNAAIVSARTNIQPENLTEKDWA
jgi:DNA replication initiation complex subunit (GINS family)